MGGMAGPVPPVPGHGPAGSAPGQGSVAGVQGQVFAAGQAPPVGYPGGTGALPPYPQPPRDPRSAGAAVGYGAPQWAAGNPGYVGGNPRYAGGVQRPQYAGGGWRPAPTPVRRAPWWQREGVISRVLAVAGVGVTLIGVVMLLVLAAQAGIFGPVPRVIAGAVFSGVLVALAARVHGRAGGHVGAVALAATGIAGGYLDIVAVTSMYHWLPSVVGYVVALGIAAGGVALAMQWRSQALAVLVVLGAALLSPAVSTELVMLLSFLIVLQIAATPVQLVRDWPFLHVVRTLPAVLVTLLAVAGASLGSESIGLRLQVLAAAIAIAVTGAIGAVLVGRRRPGDVTSSLTFAAATVPLLAAPMMFERTGATIIAGAFAAVLLGLAMAPWTPKLGARAGIPGHLTVVAAVAGSFALLEACVAVSRVQTLSIALMLVALTFLAVAGQRRSTLTAGLGAAFAVLGALAFLDVASPAMLSGQGEAEAHLGVSTALAAVATLAALAAALWCARRLGLVDRESDGTAVGVVGGLAALYAVTTLFVSIGVATGSSDGFRAGHGLATVAWMVAATASLLFGLRRLSHTPQQAKVALAAGLLVTAAALAKLFLFDLATLDGLLRAVAFLVVGVLLLLAGTRYARAFAEAADRSGSAPAN